MSPDDWRDRCDELQQEVSDLRTTVAVQAKALEASEKAMELAREDRQREINLAADERKKWEEEHNNWRKDFQKQKEEQVSGTVHNLLVDRVTKIELAMVSLPTNEAVRTLIDALDKRVSDVAGAVRDRTSKTSGMTSVWFGILGVIGLLSGLAALVSWVLKLSGNG